VFGIDLGGEVLGVLGVFLSGVGSVLTALGAIHYERKRGEKECQRRFDAFVEGAKISEHLERISGEV